MAGADDEEIRVRAELEDALSRPVDRMTDSLDDLDRQAHETSGSLAELAAAERLAGHEADAAGRDTDGLSRDVRQLGRDARSSSREVDRHSNSLGFMQRMLGRFKGVSLDLPALMKAYKIPFLVQGVQLLTSAVGALGSAGAGAVAGLAPLGGLVVAYPAAFLAAQQGMMVFRFALDDLSTSIKAILAPGASPKDVAKALDALPPALRPVATDLVAFIKGPLHDLKQDTETAIAPGLLRGLEGLETLLPVVHRNLVLTAKDMGDVAGTAGKMAQNPLVRSDLNRTMNANAYALHNAGFAGLYLARAGLALLSAFSPVLRVMSDYLRMGAHFIMVQVEAGNQSGKLTRFFQRAWALAKSVGSVIADVAVGLWNIVSAAKGVGRFMGHGLEGAAQAFRDWTSSAKGQREIKQYFRESIPVIRQFVLLGRDLVKMLLNVGHGGSSLAPLIKQIRKELLPALGDLAGGISQNYGPALVHLVTAFVKFQSALSFGPMATALKIFAKAMTLVADAVTRAPEPLRTLLATLLTMSVVLKATSFAGGKLSAVFSPLGEVIGGFTGKAEEAGGKLSLLEKGGKGARSAMAAMKAGFVGAEVEGGIMAGTFSSVGAAASTMWAAITGPIGLTVIAIIAVVALAVLLYKKWKPFRDLMNFLWAHIKSAAIDTWHWVEKVAVGAWHKLQAGWGKAQGVFSAIWKVVKVVFGLIEKIVKVYIAAWIIYFKVWWAVVSTAFKILVGIVKVAFAIIATLIISWWTFVVKPILGYLLSTGEQVFTAVWSAAKTAFNFIAGIVRWLWNSVVKPIWDAWSRFSKAVFGAIRAVFVREWHGIANIAKWLWNSVIHPVYSTLKGFVNDVWRSILSVATPIWHKLQDVVTKVADKIQAAWKKLKGFLNGVWDGVASAASNAMDGVKGAINAVIDAVNHAISAFNKLPGPNIDNIPRLATGGPIGAGRRAVVGERGPELFVPYSGNPQVIGATGQETRRFDRAGLVLPHEVYEASRRVEAVVPRSILEELSASQPPPRKPPPSNDGEPIQMHLHFHGDRVPSVSEARQAGREAFDAWQAEREDRKL